MNRAGLFVTLTALAIISLVAGCSRREAPKPAATAGLDKALLLDIARKAVGARLPSVPVENLEERVLIYTCYRDRASSRTNELFEVRFRIKGSKQQVEKEGATVFQSGEISVAIEPDGLIGTGGVRRVVATYASPDLNMLSRLDSDNSVVWGTPFYPVQRSAPPLKPDRQKIEGIAFRAISEFLPAVDIRTLQLDEFSLFDVVDPESDFTNSCYMITYWRTNSLRIAATSSRVTIDGEQVTVRVASDGQVERDGVSAKPLHFTCNRAMLEEWRRNAARNSASDNSKPGSPASPAP